MSNYINRYGLYDVKPVNENKDPSGNDGFILTCYAIKLNFLIDRYLINETFRSLKKMSNVNIPLERLPNKKEPYISRDVILGLKYLGLITIKDLEDNGWCFSPFPLPRLNVFKLVNQLWRLRNQHRNTFWRYVGYEQVYRIAFSVPLTDRAFLYRCEDKIAPLIYRVIEWFDKKIESESDSSKLIRWLKYKNVPEVEVFERYFGVEHDFVKKVKSIMMQRN